MYIITYLFAYDFVYAQLVFTYYGQRNTTLEKRLRNLIEDKR